MNSTTKSLSVDVRLGETGEEEEEDSCEIDARGLETDESIPEEDLKASRVGDDDDGDQDTAVSVEADLEVDDDDISMPKVSSLTSQSTSKPSKGKEPPVPPSRQGRKEITKIRVDLERVLTRSNQGSSNPPGHGGKREDDSCEDESSLPESESSFFGSPKIDPVLAEQMRVNKEKKPTLNWNRFEQRYVSKEVQEDPLKDILLFPPSTMKVVVDQREHRTVGPPVPDELLHDKSLEPFIRDSIEVFTCNWTIVKYAGDEVEDNYPRSARTPKHKKILPEATPRGASNGLTNVVSLAPLGGMTGNVISASGTVLGNGNKVNERSISGPSVVNQALREKKKQTITVDSPRQDQKKLSGTFIEPCTGPTEILPELLKFPETLELSCERNDLFTLPTRSGDFTTDNRKLPKPFPENPQTKIMLIVKELSLTGEGSGEPLFAQLALYDVVQKKKMTENFCFDLNPHSLLQEYDLLPDKSHPIDKETLSRSAIFTLPENTKNLYVVLKVNKFLKAETENLMANLKNKAVQSLKSKDDKSKSKDAKDFSGYAITPHVWTFIALHALQDHTGIVSGQTLTDEFRPLSRNGCFTDDNICEMLANEKELKKTKGIPGRFAVEVTKLGKKQIKGRVDPSYNLVKPVADGENAELIKEIQIFEESKRPLLSYYNNMYLYPDSGSFKGDKINLLVEVSLKAVDDPKAHPLSAVYSTSVGSKYTTSGTTAVQHRDKKPVFNDEIKIQLPGKLTSSHHLLFAFYNIIFGEKDPKKKDKKNQNQLATLGYAFYPIYQNGKIIKEDKKITVNVASSLPPSYLSDNVQQSIDYSSRASFTFHVKLLSIYPQDDNIITFFKDFQTTSELADWEFAIPSTAKNVVSIISKISPITIVNHFPVILNELFQVMCTRNEPVAREAFLAMISVLNSVIKVTDERTSYNTLLLSYVRFIFTNVKGATRYVHEEMVKHWLSCLEKKHSYFQNFVVNWFLLEVIIKSMTLKLFEGGKQPDENARSSWFPKEYVEKLKELARVLFTQTEIQSLDALTSFNLFLKDLFNIMDRGVVFELIHLFMTSLTNSQNAPVLVDTAKFKFLQAITSFEHYIPLNLPLETKIESVSTVRQDWWNCHYLASLLLHEVQQALCTKGAQKTSRTQAIITLRGLLKKHESDQRYDLQRRQRITGIYFPYILTVLDFPDEIKSSGENDWLLCFLYILKNCSRKLLRDWWKKEAQQRHVMFFSMLAHCLKVFDHNLEAEADYIAIDMMTDYIKDFEEELQQAENPVVPKIFALIQLLLESPYIHILKTLYVPFLQYIIHSLGKTLFVLPDTSFWELMCVEILRHCNVPELAIRNVACTMFYLLLQRNYEEIGNIHRIHVQSTVAISKLVGEQLKDFSCLNRSLECIKNIAKASGPEPFVSQVFELVNQIFSLIKYNTQITENSFDPELVADIYHNISETYYHSPNLRVSWLQNLASYHENNKNYEEAAQCKIHIAALIVLHLERSGKKLPITKESFLAVSPNITQEKGFRGLPEDEGLLKSNSVWRLSGLIDLLKEATVLLGKAQMFELALELYSMLSLLYKKQRDYTELIDCLEQYQTYSKKLVESTKKDNRLFSLFYRVGFYGSVLKELDMHGKEYIYKRDPRMNLSMMQQQLKDVYSKKVGDVNHIVIFPNNNEVDVSKLDPKKLYIQIASVKHYFESSEGRDSPFDQNFNTNKFIFEAAYTEGAKKGQSETSRQQKKKIIFEAELSFPYLKNRLAVVRKTETILSPIENAIELIEERVAKLRHELNTQPPRINTLQQLLQGSVVPMVNEGPLKICEVFLTKSAEYPEHHVQALKTALQNFSRYCGFAIALNKKLIKTEHFEFHNMLEKHYQAMRDKINGYVDTPYVN